MSKSPESRWEAKIVRETLDEATIYVSGHTREEAETEADNELMEGRVFEFQTLWSDSTLEISKVHPGHEVDPVHWLPDEGIICKICLRSVLWTGIAADDPANRSGRTIPGPWVHADE